MERGVLVFISLLTLLLASCEKEGEQEQCIQDFIEQADLIPYTGQQITGEFYIIASSNDRLTYFNLGHNYIDFTSPSMACNGDRLCEDETSRRCTRLKRNSENLGIIGILK